MATRKRSELELLMQAHLEDVDELAGFQIEFEFWPGRKFAFDFAWPSVMLALEVEGGRWGGRHTSGPGFDRDCRKYGEAICRGWTVMRVTDEMIYDRTAVNNVIRTYRRLLRESDGQEIRERTNAELRKIYSPVAGEGDRSLLEKKTVKSKTKSVETGTRKTGSTTTRPRKS